MSKKKKTSENVLLVPGEAGWEIWTGSTDGGFTLHSATETARAADLNDLPSGELILLFPVKAVTAIPMRVSSDDDSLFPDLAALHAERLGLRPDPMAGQLTDQFVIAREAETTSILSILLRTPGEGEMPVRGPKEFDISARALPLEGDTLGVWKEFGRWVFVFSQQGNVVYCQATSIESPSPDDALVREIRLALIQFSLQNIEITPNRVVLWTSREDAGSGALAGALSGASVEIHPRPSPILAEPRSKLLPADIRAARRIAQQRQNILLGVAAVALLYLGLIGWFGYGLWKDSSATKRLRSLAEAAAPEGAAYTTHISKMDELAPLQLANSPVDILSRIALCIPPNSGLRLSSADLSAAEIKLEGEAPQPAAVNQFSLALTKRNDLASFVWQNPEPSQSSRGWGFRYTGTNTTLANPQP